MQKSSSSRHFGVLISAKRLQVIEIELGQIFASQCASCSEPLRILLSGAKLAGEKAMLLRKHFSIFAVFAFISIGLFFACGTAHSQSDSATVNSENGAIENSASIGLTGEGASGESVAEHRNNPRISTRHPVGQGRVDETLLSTCYVDAPYRPELVYFSVYSSDQYDTWWNANYKHGYIERRSVLVTTFDASGQVVQQVTATRNDPKSSALKSPGYYRGDIGYNGPADRRSAEAAMKRMYENDANARMLMQCTQ